jgi:putative phosphoribosyl transferase
VGKGRRTHLKQSHELGADVRVQAAGTALDGFLQIPPAAKGVVLFAHGSGSSRHSPRNQFVARVLQEARLATLLVDLLTPAEDAVDARTAHLRFDIELLAGRLEGAAQWLAQEPRTQSLPTGCFGASTGAAAALIVAARRPELIKAVVSRGGRPDLAGSALAEVRVPTLLIVGSRDVEVLELNRQALSHLRGHKHLETVPGATHLFEEPGALAIVAKLAADWFLRDLRPREEFNNT